MRKCTPMLLWRSGIRRPQFRLRREEGWKVTPRYVVTVWFSGWAVQGRRGVCAHLQIPECAQFVKYDVVCHVTLSGQISFVIYLAIKVVFFTLLSCPTFHTYPNRLKSSRISRRGARAWSIPPLQSLTGAVFINAQPK